MTLPAAVGTAPFPGPVKNRPVAQLEQIAACPSLLGWNCYDGSERDAVRLWTVDDEDVPVGLGLVPGSAPTSAR